jgi:hypothetical protein
MTTLELRNSTALATTGDGFDGHTDHVEGDDSLEQQGLIRGTHLKFGATAQWERRDGETIGCNVKLIVTDIVRPNFNSFSVSSAASAMQVFDLA